MNKYFKPTPPVSTSAWASGANYKKPFQIKTTLRFNGKTGLSHCFRIHATQDEKTSFNAFAPGINGEHHNYGLSTFQAIK
jgi:hypothetical protein